GVEEAADEPRHPVPTPRLREDQRVGAVPEAEAAALDEDRESDVRDVPDEAVVAFEDVGQGLPVGGALRPPAPALERSLESPDRLEHAENLVLVACAVRA